MKEELEKSVTANATKATEAKGADDALKFSQAALNAAHALITLTGCARTPKQEYERIPATQIQQH